MVPDQSICILEGNLEIQLYDSYYSDPDVNDSHTWFQTHGCTFGVDLSPTLLLAIEDANSYSYDGYACTVNLYVQDNDSENFGANPL